MKVEPVESGKGAAQVTMEVRGQGPPDQEGRRAQDPPAHLPRGQLLRGRRARLAVRRRPARRRRHPGHADRRAGAVRRPPDGAPARHAQRPPDLPARVLEGPRRTAARRASTRRSSTGSRPTSTRRSPTTRRSARTRTATSSALLKGQQKTFAALVKDENALKGLVTNFNVTAAALRARGRGARAVGAGAARHAQDRLPGARARSTRRCRRCARSPTTRCRACARPTRRSRPRMPFITPGAPPDVRGRAARHRARAAPDDPGPREVRPDLGAVPARVARAVGLHEQRAGAVHGPARSRTPRRATRPRTRTSRCARSSSAACRASRARAASPTATTSTSTPA